MRGWFLEKKIESAVAQEGKWEKITMEIVTVEGNTKYSESKKLINQANKEKQLVLFIGAGASVDSGMPLWKDAIKIIANRLGMDSSKSLDNLIVPQYYYNSRGEKEYTQLIREIFHYDDKLYPTKIHNAIIQFDTDTILTTNYDHILEQAAEDNGKFLQVISQDIDLPYRKAGMELVKIHGDFEHNNYVLKEDDYLHYHSNFKLIENYVKSLIGTKTVLFIGYSLSDPDVKHIFSWVKEILDENIQRAYLIEAERPYDKSEDEYFRHLGVNLIYSRELLKEPTTTSNNLLCTLEYLLSEDTEEKNMVDALCYSLKPLSSMNYVLKKYVESAIDEANINKDDIHMYIERSSLVFLANEENDYNGFIDELADNFNSNKITGKGEKISLITDVLVNSTLKEMRKHIHKGIVKDETYPIPEKSRPNWIKALYNFDYGELNNICEHNTKILSERNVEMYMQQAYICTFLEDYLTAYICLENAANYYYRKREYVWYFIATWNKRNIAQIISNGFIYNRILDADMLETIKFDLDQIDLDRTLQSIPDSGYDNYQFLRDLIGFKVNSELFYDVFRDSVNTNKQANEIYSLFAGLPAYESLRERTIDYYRYILYNYLIVDGYRENSSIFDLYIRTILLSVAAPDKELPIPVGHFGSGNVHADSLSPDDIHLILRYTNSSSLSKLLRELNIRQIEVDKECENYLKILAENIPTVFNSLVSNQKDKFWTFIVLISHISVSDSVIEKVVQTMCSIDDDEYLSGKNSILSRFVDAIYSCGHYSNKDICQSIKKLLHKLLFLISKDKTDRAIYHDSVTAMSAFCSEGHIQLSDRNLIDSLLNSKCEFLVAELAKYCNESTKEHIDDYFKKRRIGNTYQDYKLYALLLIEDIIDLDVKVEKNALAFIRKSSEKEQEQEKNGTYSYPKNDLITWYLEVYWKGKIQDSSSLLELIKKFGSGINEWLVDIDGYDYEKMDVSWLTMCNSSLLEELAEKADIREKIIKAFKKQYQSKYVDDIVVRIIVKYFL